MKHRTLVLALAVGALAASGLLWVFRKPQAAGHVAAPSKAELIRLANLERQKKDGIIAPPKKTGSLRTEEEKAATQNAMPSRDTSLTLLDLKRPPTEAELIRAGQLLEPLSPTGPADPQKLGDPVMRTQQEKDNLLFGQAMNAWNRSLYDKAQSLFFKHLKEFPSSPWAAESRLHIATSSLQRGYLLACINQSNQVLQDAAKGTPAYQKALLLKANALMQQQRSEEAAKIYSEALVTETDGRRRTQVAAWLVALSQAGKN